MNKLVSIISPCYNGAKYLHAFLDSVLNQTYPYIELIFIDDCSADNSLDIVESYIDCFKEKGYCLKIVKMPENRGQAAAINEGLKIFNGEYLMWMDSDDVFIDYAIEHKVVFLQNNPDVDFCLNGGYVVNEDDIFKPLRIIKRNIPNDTDDLFSDLIYEKNVTFAPGIIFVRSMSFKKAIPSLHIFESREGQNWQLMLPLAYSCKHGYLEECLFYYVVHKDSHSHAQRGFEEEIQRQENFKKLLIATIETIVEMNNTDKEKWINNILIKILLKKLRICIRFRRKKEYVRYKEELKTLGVNLDIKDSFVLYPFFCAYESIRHRLK